MYVFFWDIDGTLLTSQRAGAAALDAACRELMSVAVDWSRIDFRGHTDRSIAQRTLAAYGQPSDDDAIDRLLGCYESHLPRRLAEREVRPLPGVVEVLERLHRRPDALSMLLTGNTRRGARAKLERCGLIRYFHGPNGGPPPFGAFAESGILRESVARAAWDLAVHAIPRLTGERGFVIGDTPHDVACGKAIGVRTVAVASGGYSLGELQACQPWRLWERLPEPGEFERALGLE